MHEDEYKELLNLKHQLERAEDTAEKQKEIETLKGLLWTQMVRVRDRISELQELEGVYEEVLEDL